MEHHTATKINYYYRNTVGSHKKKGNNSQKIHPESYD